MDIDINAPIVLLFMSPAIAKALIGLLRYLLAGGKRKKR